MFFQSWERILEIIIVGVFAYVSMIIILRVSGKRTLSKMNAFDLVVTVAFGSALSNVILSKDTKLADGITAFVLLALLQFIAAFMSIRSKTISKLIKSKPQLLYYQGEFLESEMRSERVLQVEILQAIRTQGLSSINEAEAVILETDGSLSVIKKSGSDETALRDVDGHQ